MLRLQQLRAAVLAAACIAALAPATAAAQASLAKRVQEHTLANGMKFLLVERHESPTVAMYLRFKVGAVDEWTGISGTAHLLEHMLFKGTTTLGTRDWTREKPLLEEIEKVGSALDEEEMKGDGADQKKTTELRSKLEALHKQHKALVIKDEIDELYSKNGGVGFNAMTNKDTTTYVLSLPSNRLELWARIEADRMAQPVLREFYSERDVVMEERRRSIDSRPAGALHELFIGAAFLAHNYRVPTIGWPSELRFLTLENTSKFRKTFYAPNNTVAAIVGDFEPKKVVAMVEKYFGPIPAQPLPRPYSTQEPEQRGERRVRYESDANPQVMLGYHKPTLPTREDYVLDVAQAVLSSGRTSRFYKALVEGKQLALSVGCSNGSPGSRFANLFVISALPRTPHSIAELEAGIYEELDRLVREPVSTRELQKVLNQVEADLIRGMDTNSGLADSLTYFQTVAGDWRYLVKYLDVVKTVTPAELQTVAGRFLVAKNRTVAELVRVPKAEKAPAGAPAAAKDE